MLMYQPEEERLKTKRFKYAMFLSLIFVPFMVVWNSYGNYLIKQDYFIDYSKPKQYPRPTMRYDRDLPHFKNGSSIFEPVIPSN